jgi:hypothetical protein
MRWVLGAGAIVLLVALALSGCDMGAAPPPTGVLPETGETPAEGTTPEATAELTPPPAVTGTAEVAPTEGVTATADVTGTAEVTGTEAPAAGEAPTVDGAIDEGEYANTITVGDSQVWWFNDGESLTLAVEGPTEGWIGVGLDPETGMQGADFKLASLAGGEQSVTDAFGTQPTGPNHPPDDELGGTQDIEESAVVQENGTLRFEFRIPLDSGDEFDKPLQPGETYPILVAHAPTSEYNAYHSFRLEGEITLDAVP